MKIKIKVNKSKSKNNLFTAWNCHSKQKKAKLICSRPGTAIQNRKSKINLFTAGNCHSNLGRDWNAVTGIMAAYFRNDGWKEDIVLKEEMAKYVKQGFQRREMLDFLKRDFAQYAWSLRTVDRRLRHFDIQYNDKNVSVEEVKDVVKKELDGPGKLLGYRAMHRKVRQVHDLNVPRDLVHAAMYDLDPKGLEARGPVGKKKTIPKGSFTTKGPNWVHSLDGHDKLMGYQNSTFPLAVYGCIDTASRKLLWLRIWVTNSDPKVIGRWYLEYLYEARIMPSMIRLDRGTETGTMATIHAFLRRNHDDMDDPCESIIYGPSTSNQVSTYLFVYFFYVSVKKKCECNWSCHIRLLFLCFSLHYSA